MCYKCRHIICQIPSKLVVSQTVLLQGTYGSLQKCNEKELIDLMHWGGSNQGYYYTLKTVSRKEP